MAKAKTDGADVKSVLSNLESTLEVYLVKKAPALPTQWRELLVRFAPYLAIIGVIVGVPGVLALFGLGALIVPFGTIGGIASGKPFLGVGYLFNVVFLGLMVLLEALSIPGLFGRKKAGWNFMFWGTLVGAVQNVLSFNIGGLVIGTLLSLYLLFQVKEYYK